METKLFVQTVQREAALNANRYGIITYLAATLTLILTILELAEFSLLDVLAVKHLLRGVMGAIKWSAKCAKS